MELTLGEPLTLQGVAFVSFVSTDRALLHQIRKMIAMVCALSFVAPCSSDAIVKARRCLRCPVSLSPSCSLTLRRALYANYERRRPLDRYRCISQSARVHSKPFWPNISYLMWEIVLPVESFTQFVAALDAYQMTTAAPSVAPTQKKLNKRSRDTGRRRACRGRMRMPPRNPREAGCAFLHVVSFRGYRLLMRLDRGPKYLKIGIPTT